MALIALWREPITRLLLGAEFLAMILVVVYVGAVAVLFLFVVMMLDIDFAELKGEMAKYMPLGLLIGWSRLAAQMFDPMIQSLRPIPITAWLPFSIALFGIRDMGSIFLIFLGGFYAIVVNTTQGARDVERNLMRAAMMMGSTRSQLLWRVVFPSAMPSIFTGLRIGLGISWTAVIVSEMVAVKSGLGYVLWDAYYVGRMDIVLADMVSIGAMGYLSDRLIVFIEQRVLRWRMLQNH